jgi:hypothetical protein
MVLTVGCPILLLTYVGYFFVSTVSQTEAELNSRKVSVVVRLKKGYVNIEQLKHCQSDHELYV